MPGQMRVTPADLRAGAPTFAAAGEAVDAALRALQGALPDAAEMCGDDEAGAAFLASYRPMADQLQQAMQAIATGLPTVGQGLVTTADNIERADGSSVMRTGG